MTNAWKTLIRATGFPRQSPNRQPHNETRQSHNVFSNQHDVPTVNLRNQNHPAALRNKSMGESTNRFIPRSPQDARITCLETVAHQHRTPQIAAAQISNPSANTSSAQAEYVKSKKSQSVKSIFKDEKF